MRVTKPRTAPRPLRHASSPGVFCRAPARYPDTGELKDTHRPCATLAYRHAGLASRIPPTGSTPRIPSGPKAPLARTATACQTGQRGPPPAKRRTARTRLPVLPAYRSVTRPSTGPGVLCAKAPCPVHGTGVSCPEPTRHTPAQRRCRKPLTTLSAGHCRQHPRQTSERQRPPREFPKAAVCDCPTEPDTMSSCIRRNAQANLGARCPL